MELLPFILITKVRTDCVCGILVAWAGVIKLGCPAAAYKLPKFARLLSQKIFIVLSSASDLAQEMALGTVAVVLFHAILIRTRKILFLFHEPNPYFLCFFLSFSFLSGMK